MEAVVEIKKEVESGEEGAEIAESRSKEECRRRGLRAPRLASLTYDEVVTFLEEYDAFRACGGEADLFRCIRRGTLKYVGILMERKDPETWPEAELRKGIEELVKEPVADVARRLSVIAMKGEGLAALQSFTEEFLHEVGRLAMGKEGDHEEMQDKLIHFYLKGVRPVELGSRITLEFDVRPRSSLDECIRVVHTRVRSATEAALGPPSFSPRASPAALRGDGVPRGAGAFHNNRRPFQGQCHRCSGWGHRAFDCPSPDQAPRGPHGTQSPTPLGSQRDPAPPSQGRAPSTLPPPRGGVGGKTQLTCYRCGEVGHTSARCMAPSPVPRESAPTAQPVESAAKSCSDAPAQFVVQGAVYGKPYSMLVDTGAACSLISQTSLDNLMTVMQVPLGRPQEPKRLRLADGSVVDATLVVLLQVELDGESLGYFDFWVLPDAQDDLVIGMDILSANGIVIDAEERRVMKKQHLAVRHEDDLTVEDGADLLHDLLNPQLMDVEQIQGHERTRQLVKEFEDLFRPAQAGEPPAAMESMRIPLLPGAKPCALPVRRASKVRSDFIEDTCQKLLRLGYIRPSRSSWATVATAVPKGADSWRMVIDYRALNVRTKVDRASITRLDMAMEAVQGARFFAVLDLAAGYHQVAVQEEDIEKTAFRTPSGAFYEWTRMPFGLSGAPACFQYGINHVLAGLLWKACVAYMDDILVKGATYEEYLANLRSVFERLRRAGLRLQPRKCRFDVEEVNYLGFLVSGQGRRPNPDRVRALRDVPSPRTQKELRSVLGALSYLRDFVPSFAMKAQPLTRRLRRNVKIEWDEDAEAAFRGLIDDVANAILLAHPDMALPFALVTDASKLGLGAVLVQKGQSGWRVVSLASRTLVDAETRYTTIELETLAIVWGCQRFRHFLLDSKFMIFTDHKNLQWLDKATSPRVVRMRHQLAEFDFVIEYRPGRDNNLADWLSRRTDAVSAAPIASVSVEVEIFDLFDTDFNARVAQAQARAPESEWAQWEAKGALLHEATGQWILKRDKHYVRIIPAAEDKMKKEIIALAHCSTAAGHVGVTRTIDRIHSVAVWKGLKADVRQFVSHCVRCQKAKQLPDRTKTVMSYQVSAPFDVVHLDFVGPMSPEARSGSKFLLVCVDRFSHWTEIVPLKRATAKAVTRVLFDRFVCRMGLPKAIVTDNGQQFVGSLLKQFCAKMHIDAKQVTAYRPQANGVVERTNRVIGETLRALCHHTKDEWDVFVPEVQAAINCAKSRVTGFSPYEILFGRQPATVFSLTMELPDDQFQVTEDDEHGQDVATRRAAQLQKVIALVKKRQEREAASVGRYYAKKFKDVAPFQAGDLVLYLVPNADGIRNPLDNRWRGPCMIAARVNQVIYTIRDLVTGEERNVHRERLAAFKDAKMDTREALRKVRDEPLGAIHASGTPIDYKIIGADVYLKMDWGPDFPSTWERKQTVIYNPTVRKYLIDNDLLDHFCLTDQIGGDGELQRGFEQVERQDEALDRQDEVLERQDEALDRQNEVLERQDEVLDRQEEVLERQDEVFQRQNEGVERRDGQIEGQQQVLPESDQVGEEGDRGKSLPSVEKGEDVENGSGMAYQKEQSPQRRLRSNRRRSQRAKMAEFKIRGMAE